MPTSVAAGLVAYLVTLGFAFGDAVIDPMGWMLAGLLVAAVRSDDESTPLADQQGATDRIVAGGVAVLALVGAVCAAGGVLAEVRLQRAVDEQAAGEIDAALDTLDAAVAVAPARYDLDQVAARIVTQSLAPELVDAALDPVQSRILGHRTTSTCCSGPTVEASLSVRRDARSASRCRRPVRRGTVRRCGRWKRGGRADRVTGRRSR